MHICSYVYTCIYIYKFIVYILHGSVTLDESVYIQLHWLLHSQCMYIYIRWVSVYTLDESLTLQHTATHCNTLQHIATHCNTLQHTAVYTLDEPLTRKDTVSYSIQQRLHWCMCVGAVGACAYVCIYMYIYMNKYIYIYITWVCHSEKKRHVIFNTAEVTLMYVCAYMCTCMYIYVYIYG